MKRILTLLVAIQLIAFNGFSQAKKSIVIDSPEYQKAKTEGTLDQFNLVLDLGKTTKNGVSTPVATPANYNKSRDIDCNCYEEPDNTYITPSGLVSCDDCTSGVINLPFTFNFYGTPYNSLYINSNGNVTFGNSMTTFTSTALAAPNANAIAAPFWADVDVRGAGAVRYKIYDNAIFINWHNVGYFNSMNDKINNFQLILTDGTHPSVPNGNNIAFCYGDMQWTTGSASGGTNGFGGTPATAGLNKGGNTQSFFQLARFDHPGTDFDGALGNPDGISWLDNKSFFFDVTDVANVPPIPQGVSPCDTFKVCALGDSAAFNIMFFAPEANQNTTITWDNGGLTDLVEVINEPGLNGNSAQLVLSLVGTPQNEGVYNITVTATDSYITPGVTTLNFTIIVDGDIVSSLNPELDIDLTCGNAQVGVLNGPYDTYLWNDGTMGQTNNFTESGTIGVTVSRDKCYKMVGVDIHIPQPVIPQFTGIVGLCPGEDSTLVHLSNFDLMSSVHWGVGNTEYNDTDSAYLTPGTHQITVVDTSGLCTRVTPITITQSVASVFPQFPIIKCNTTTHQVTGASAGTGAIWSSPNPEITFNGAATANVSNPVIASSAPGVYTVQLTTACGEPFSGQITFSATPDILFGDTVVCGRTFEVPDGSVWTADGGSWMNLDPNGITFDPSLQDLDPTITLSNNYPLPYEMNLRIYDKHCTQLYDQVKVTFVPAGQPNFPPVACDLNTWDLTVDSYDGGTWFVFDNPGTPWKEDTAYVFEFGDTSEIPHMIVSTPGTYKISYHDNFCNITTEGEVNFPPYLWAEIRDTMLCEGVIYTMPVDVSNVAVNYAWNTGATSPSIEISEPGVYIVSITNVCETYTDTATVVYYKCDIEAPNVISLSSTVGNNVWYVQEQGIERYECFIVNRWGTVIAELNESNPTWNGKDRNDNLVSEGVYFYNIKGFAFGGIEVNKQGFITVVK